MQEFLRLRHSLLGQGDGARLLVHREVELAAEPRNDPVHRVVQVGGVLGGAADDEGGPRLVDEDRVHLVHDGVVEEPLHLLAVAVAFGARVGAMDEVLGAELHVVPQVVETELVVGPVGDVGPVGRAPLLVAQVVLDHADAEPQELVEAAHPLRVAARQVVVHRDHVDALAGERVQDRREGRHQRLAFAGLHFGDAAPVQDGAAEELYVEVAHPQRTPGAFPAHGEYLGHQLRQAARRSPRGCGAPRSGRRVPDPRVPSARARARRLRRPTTGAVSVPGRISSRRSWSGRSETRVGAG